ncbi:helix-turn-helix transcriptional regulator [Alkaliphilus crotonatoxidans]
MINYCYFEKHIIKMLKDFYLCTHIPIRTYNFDGSIIHTEGYASRYDELFRQFDLYEQIKEKMLEEDGDHLVTLTCREDFYFTACRICPKTVHRGIHIIGPYTCKPENSNDLLYKPKNCIPHLVTLLRNIGSESPYLRHLQIKEEQIHSLHVKRALDYITAHYHEPVTLTSITRYLKISRSYFCTILKKETGKTFSQILNEIRVEKSKRLLLETDLPLLEVALAVGFNNQNYYNMAFKRLTKETPSSFRNTAFDVQSEILPSDSLNKGIT